MVSKDHKLSVRRQCALLTLVRSNLYYHVWMPRFTQGIYERFGRYDRVQSCVRPQIAT